MRLVAATLALFTFAMPLSAPAADATGVRVIRDIAYVPNASYADNKDKLDLYVPEGRTNVPVIVSYYGGALMSGDKSQQGFIGQRFAAAGFATAGVNYPLSPAVLHPADIHDAAASLGWVQRDNAKYGGHPDEACMVLILFSRR